jgi:hypothetical protein
LEINHGKFIHLTTPIHGRLPRICPSTGWTYAGYDIPPGATVSSSSYLVHYKEDVFPNPDIRDPEQWLTTDEATLKLRERHFVPFSKGARACIGLNLAYAEIYIGLATIVRLFRVVEVVDKELVTSEMFATGLLNAQSGATPSLSYIPIFMVFSGLVEMRMYATGFREECRMKIPSKLAIEFLLETHDIVT